MEKKPITHPMNYDQYSIERKYLYLDHEGNLDVDALKEDYNDYLLNFVKKQSNQMIITSIGVL